MGGLMKTVMFDVDGVLADFTKGFTEVAYRMYGTPVRFMTDMAYYNDFGLDDEQVAEVWRYISAWRDWWSNLLPLVSPEVFYQIQNLARLNQVYFVTNRYHGTPSTQNQTVRFLQWHGIESPSVIVSKHKAEVARALRVQFSIEDKAENASEIADVDVRSYLIDRRYNQIDVDPRVIRVATVSEFLEDVQYSRDVFHEERPREMGEGRSAET